MSATHPVAAQNVEPLKRVRQTEAEAEARLAQAKAQVDAAIQRLLAEAEETVRVARAEGEKARVAALADARCRAAAEAAGILAEGRKAAEQIELKATQSVAAKREAVLGIVLGGFRGGA